MSEFDLTVGALYGKHKNFSQFGTMKWTEQTSSESDSEFSRGTSKKKMQKFRYEWMQMNNGVTV